MSKSGDAKTALNRSMEVLGITLYDIVRFRQEGIRIFVAPCTPRNTPDFQTHAKYAFVSAL